MSNSRANAAADYLLSTRSVVQAAKQLRRNLAADVAKRENSITRLERATERQEGGATGFRSFMFNELETIPEAETAVRERVQEDTLESISADLHVANVLMAAGETVGETGDEADPDRLDEAIRRLDETTRDIKPSQSGSLTGGPEPVRFGFEETDEPVGSTVVESEVFESQPADEPAEPARSDDLPSAIANFRQHTDQSLDMLVSAALETVKEVLANLSGIVGKKVLQALSRLGAAAMETIPGKSTGRLISQGIKKLEAAVNALIRLMGSKALAEIKGPVERFWKDFQNGEQTEKLLGWACGVEPARDHVTKMLQTDGLTPEALDRAITKLEQLPAAFKKKMGIATGLAVVVGSALPLLALVPAIGQSHAALIAASIGVLILASIILIGRDYTDSGDLLHRVQGVCGIADEVRPA